MRTFTKFVKKKIADIENFITIFSVKNIDIGTQESQFP